MFTLLSCFKLPWSSPGYRNLDDARKRYPRPRGTTIFSAALSVAALGAAAVTVFYLITDLYRYASAQEVDSYLNTCACITLKCIQKNPLYASLDAPFTLIEK